MKKSAFYFKKRWAFEFLVGVAISSWNYGREIDVGVGPLILHAFATHNQRSTNTLNISINLPFCVAGYRRSRSRLT